MRRVLSILSLFAVCLCLSCFAGVNQVGAFSGDTLFTNDVKVKYGGEAVVAIPTESMFSAVAKNVIDGTNEYAEVNFQCEDACHEKFESVIDAAVRLKSGDDGLNKDPTLTIILAGGPDYPEYLLSG